MMGTLFLKQANYLFIYVATERLWLDALPSIANDFYWGSNPWPRVY